MMKMKDKRKEEITAVYKRYINTLFSYGCKFTSDKELVKDCIHDVFINLLEMENFSTVLNPKSYVLRAFRNKLFDELSKSIPCSIDDMPFSFSQSVTEENEFLTEDRNRNLKLYIQKIFENLTDRQREVVYLHYIEEMDYEDISRFLGITYQRVRNITSEALAHLRQKFGNAPPDFLLLMIL
jgi:RNA polymerase sigma factor (sigma-70 family)